MLQQRGFHNDMVIKMPKASLNQLNDKFKFKLI